MKRPIDVLAQRLFCGWIAFSLGVGSSDRVLAQDDAESSTTLQVTFLINEGFLLQGADKSVLIDAFVRDEYYGYGALPEETYQQLIGGRAPFADVSLALTSHVHLDHFQTEPAVRFLQTHPKSLLVSGEEVVLAIRDSKLQPSVAAQAQILWPDQGKVQPVEHDGIRVEGFRLRHGGARNNEIQNLGLIIHLGKFSILHVGDAEASKENLQPYDLSAREIDVAILPVWMFEHRQLVDRHIGAKTYIAAHIPFNDLAKTKRELGNSQPDVIVLEKPLETWTALSGRPD